MIIEKQYNNTSMLSTVIEKFRGLLWIVDEKYHLVMTNSNFRDHYRKMYGVDLKIGDYLHDHLSKSEKEKWNSYYKDAFQGKSFLINQENIIEDKSHWMQYHFTKVSVNSNDENLILVQAVDIAFLQPFLAMQHGIMECWNIGIMSDKSGRYHF